jgi:transposase-like protein
VADPAAIELKELRRKLANAEMDRDILKKALAICSRDPDLKRGLS